MVRRAGPFDLPRLLYSPERSLLSHRFRPEHADKCDAISGFADLNNSKAYSIVRAFPITQPLLEIIEILTFHAEFQLLPGVINNLIKVDFICPFSAKLVHDERPQHAVALKLWFVKELIGG